MELEITSPALGAADREDAAEPEGRAVVVRPHRISRLPDHPAGRRRLFRAAQRLYRRPVEDAAGLGFRRPHPGGAEECRHLRHGDRHASAKATTSTAFPACIPARSSTSTARICSTPPACSPPRPGTSSRRRREKLHTDDVAGCSFIGANDFSLATVDWYTRFITTGGVLMTGSPKEKNFKPQVNSPEGIGALQMLIDLLPYAPKNVTKYGFAENVDGFSTGKIAQMIFWSTIAGPVLNSENSMVADTTGDDTGPVRPTASRRARSRAAGASASRRTSTRRGRRRPGWR